MVHYLTPSNNSFSTEYVNARKIEGRILSDKEVSKLPDIEPNHKHYFEWEVRKKTCNRFLAYLSKKASNSILDIGCGNGWFSNKIAQNTRANVTAIDINDIELEQADRIFKKENLKFAYADLFNVQFSGAPFDLIILNSSIQYFEHFQLLLKRLNQLLSPTGEIHILDSPFYKSDEIHAAQERTLAYYASIGCDSMAANYYHHNIKNIENFDFLYKPNRLWRIFNGKKQSPFLWIRASKKQLN